MADEPHVIRGIDWKATFPFVSLFRGFRVAIHPSKLILALVGLVLIFLGGELLDTCWPQDHRAVPDELEIYGLSFASVTPVEDFKAVREREQKALRDAFDARRKEIGKPDGTLADLKWNIEVNRDKAVTAARDAWNKDPKKQSAEAKLELNRQINAAYAMAALQWEQDKSVKGVGLFETFCGHEVGMLNQMVLAVRMGNWVGVGGVVDAIKSFFVFAPMWAMVYHPVYFTIFFLYYLCIWSIFGGAISRIAAVHVARDEKISIRQALRFSTSKFLSFLSAPIIPMLIIVVVGLVVAVGGFILNIPFLGPVIVGLLFFLALAAGFVMTLVLIGMAGGMNLMYPTIAVEGSDSFDAISRSFSYLYARPWRLGFYTAVSILYGSLCYIFVRYFIYLMLTLTHKFVGLFVFYHAENAAPLWNVIWPSPSEVGRLSYDISYLTLSSGQAFGAFLVSLWVYLVIAILGAFAVSFYFSASTIIYYLMRNEVDATEMDDVYLEQADDEFAEAGPVGSTGGSTGGTTTVAVATTTVNVPVGTSSDSISSPQALAPDSAPNATSESPAEGAQPEPPEGSN